MACGRQAGVASTRQAEDAGVPGVEVRKLAARGALTRMGHGVYRHAGVPADEWTELTATLARVGAVRSASPAISHVGARVSLSE